MNFMSVKHSKPTSPGIRESFGIMLRRWDCERFIVTVRKVECGVRNIFASKVEDRPSLIISDSVVQLHGSQPVLPVRGSAGPQTPFKSPVPSRVTVSASAPVSPGARGATRPTCAEVALVGHSGLIAHGEYVDRRLRDGRRVILWETTAATLTPETKLIFKS